MTVEHRRIRLDVLAALEPEDRQHDEQIPVNPHELDALIEVARAAHAERLNVYKGDRLGQALELFDFGADA